MMKTASGMTTRRAHYITQFSEFYFILPDTAILTSHFFAGLTISSLTVLYKLSAFRSLNE